MLINYFKADTILSGGMRVKKNPEHFTIKLCNKNMVNKVLLV